MATTGATGAARTQHTQRTNSSNAAHKSQEDQDTQALKTLLSLVFTVALAGNQSATANTAARYATVAGQTLLLINAADQNQAFVDPSINSSAQEGSNFAEKLAEGVVDLLSTQREKQEAPEPQGLKEKYQKAQELKQESKDLKREVQDEHDEVGVLLGKASGKEGNTKDKTKKRTKAFEAAISDLRTERRTILNSLQKAQLDGDDDAEKAAKKTLARHDVKQGIFESTSPTKRAQKGGLERTAYLAEAVGHQLEIIDRAQEAPEQKKRKSLFSVFGRRAQVDESPASRTRAIAGAQEEIARLHAEAKPAKNSKLDKILKTHMPSEDSVQEEQAPRSTKESNIPEAIEEVVIPEINYENAVNALRV